MAPGVFDCRTYYVRCVLLKDLGTEEVPQALRCEEELRQVTQAAMQVSAGKLQNQPPNSPRFTEVHERSLRVGSWLLPNVEARTAALEARLPPPKDVHVWVFDNPTCDAR